MKLYLAGPMTGRPDDNLPAFREAAARLRALGDEVVSPAETAGEPQTARSWAGWMRRDIPLLLQCEAVTCLPGWEYSRGATLETDIARRLGMPLYCAMTLERFEAERRGRAVHDGSLESTLSEVVTWAQETFGPSTPEAKVAHLVEEAHELAADPTDAEEMADVVMIVAHLAAGLGIDLNAAIRRKLEKNRSRTWATPDDRGVVRHIERMEVA